MGTGDNGSGNGSQVCNCHADLIESIDGLLLRLDSYEKTAGRLIGYFKLLVGYALITKLNNLDPEVVDKIISVLQK